MSDSLCRHGRVTGRVQGVGFRDWTLRQASRKGIRGWVRNCADGSVEVMLYGDRSVVEDMTRRLRQGPMLSRVDEMTYQDLDVQKADLVGVPLVGGPLVGGDISGGIFTKREDAP